MSGSEGEIRVHVVMNIIVCGQFLASPSAKYTSVMIALQSSDKHNIHHTIKQ